MVFDLNSIYTYMYTIYIYPHGIPMIAHRKSAAFEVDPGRDQRLGPGRGLQEPPESRGPLVGPRENNGPFS